MAETDSKPPVVLSCSGRTPYGRLSNDLAATLDQQGDAEMICAMELTQQLSSEQLTELCKRRIIALDGCQSECVHRCLDKLGVSPELYINLLSDVGLNLKDDEECNLQDLYRILQEISERIGKS